MAYRIEYSPTADRILATMDPQTRRRVVDYMDQEIAPLDNARDYGGQLIDPKFYGHWRYYAGEWRVICDIQKDSLMVLFLREMTREEKRAVFMQESRESREEYERTGRHVTFEEVAAWLATWGTDHEIDPPIPHL